MRSIKINIKPENLTLELTLLPSESEVSMGSVLRKIKEALPELEVTAVGGPLKHVSRLQVVRDYPTPEQGYKLNIGPFKGISLADVDPVVLNTWMSVNFRQVPPTEKAVIDNYLNIKLKKEKKDDY